MKIEKWLQVGIDNGYISEISCYTHDGPNMTDEEATKWDNGEDPCMFIVRVWE